MHASLAVMFKCRSDTSRQGASAQRCFCQSVSQHWETNTFTHVQIQTHTHTHSTYNVGLREWWSRELTSDALLFLHYWWYQSTQEGSVCVYSMCVWIYSMFVLLRFNINALYAYSAAISFSRGNSEGQTWNTSVTLLNTSKCLQNHIID